MFLIMIAYISALCLLNFGCYLSTHYVVNMMICRVRLMFRGNVTWPIETDGNDFTYLWIRLLVWSGIMSYLLLCCMVDSYCSICVIHDIICLIIRLYLPLYHNRSEMKYLLLLSLCIVLRYYTKVHLSFKETCPPCNL